MRVPLLALALALALGLPSAAHAQSDAGYFSSNDTKYSRLANGKLFVSIARSDPAVRKRVQGRTIVIRCDAARATVFWPRSRVRMTVRLSRPTSTAQRECSLRTRSGKVIDRAKMEPPSYGGPGSDSPDPY
jgi:hypothetical protein